MVGRLDHQFRPTDLFTARYYINNSGTNNSGTYGIPASDPAGDITDVRVQSMLGALTHIFRPNLVNDLRVTYLRRKYLDTRPGYSDNLAATIGLTGVSDAAFPAFTIPGYASLGNSTAVYRFQTPILDRAGSGFALLESRQACLEIRLRIPRRGQRRNPRPRVGRQFHHQPADHGPARRFRNGQRAGQLPARRGERGLRAGLRQDSVAGLLPGGLRAGRLARHATV